MLHTDHETRVLLARERQSALHQDARRTPRASADQSTFARLAVRRHVIRVRAQVLRWRRTPRVSTAGTPQTTT
jgi:hypothetical protein